MRRSRTRASKKGLRFAEGFESWLNDRELCRMPVFDNLHIVHSDVDEM